MTAPAGICPLPGHVAEITDGRNYDVAVRLPGGRAGEIIGSDVPAWVARVIVACAGEPVIVTVHLESSPRRPVTTPSRAAGGPNGPSQPAAPPLAAAGRPRVTGGETQMRDDDAGCGP